MAYVDWKKTHAELQVNLNMNELLDLIRQLEQPAQRKLIQEVMCDWTDDQREETREWLGE